MLIPSGGSSGARADYATGRCVLSIPDSQFDFTPVANNGYFNGSAITTNAVSTRITASNGASSGSQFDPAARGNYTRNEFALHPGAYPLKTLFETGDLAFFANIGTLVGTQQINIWTFLKAGADIKSNFGAITSPKLSFPNLLKITQ